MDQVKNLINGLGILQRISVAAAVLIAGGALYFIVHYRHEGDFRALYSSMAPEDAAQVVQKLKESNVEYRLTENGGTVLVPSGRLADSRLTLASAGLPKSGRIGFELFDKTNFGATELVEHVNYQRALEGELERSIMSMAEVIQARVHLTFPKESVFLDQQQPAKASVMVKLHPGAHLSAQNVVAVSNLIASAVEGLNPDGVSVLDMDGNLLSHPKLTMSGDSQVTSEALEVRQQIERDLVTKINTTLEPLLGANEFRAGASVDCDLSSAEQQEEIFNPDQSVMASSQKTEDTNERAAAGGIPGTASNLPHPPEQSGGGGTSHRTENVTYQTSRMVKHTRIPQGVIRRMSLSVLVGQPSHWEGSGKTRRRVTVPPSPEKLKTIRDLIAGITGFSEQRGDQLIVETLPFESAMEADPGLFAPLPLASKPFVGPKWMEPVMKYQTTILIVVALLVGLSFLLRIAMRLLASRRPAQATAVVRELPMGGYQDQEQSSAAPVPVAQTAAAQASGQSAAAPASLPAAPIPLPPLDEKAIGRIRTITENNPVVATNVIRMWLQRP
ncbi:MAG TPA: flagellar basal-body MS-ring/collar protein FliF [Bryobacteraceae bacterium]